MAVDPQQPVYAIQPMEALLNEAVAPRRFVMSLIGSLAVIALVLAIIGIYGVISFSVNERTREIGIRMALGAKGQDVMIMVLGQGMRVAALGIGLGLAIAFVLTRFLKTLLFEVSASDPKTFALVAFTISAVALLACYLPARRATTVDPLIALKDE